MSASAAFFGRRREWSRWKHALLKRYLPKFVGILGSRHDLIYFVDGFAGAGGYAGDHDGAPWVDGSPLLAARLASEIAGSGKWSYALRCINVEHDKDIYPSLCAATSAFPPPLVANLHGTFRRHFNTILNHVGAAPALFFLDPFGYAGMEWDLIGRLAERAKAAPTEVIINFLIDEIDQAAGWVDSREQKAAPAFVRRVDALYGTEQWRDIVLAEQRTEERKRRLTRLYQERLSSAFGYAARYSVRAIDGSIRYYLLYGTRHPRGAREMSDVVYRVENDYATAKLDLERDRPVQLGFEDIGKPLPSPDAERAAMLERLSADVADLGLERGRIRFGDIQNQLAVSWFGRAITPHFRAACGRLIREGRIIRDSEKGIGDRTLLVFRQE
ncbi:MAG TPA: three-Cys-motif partner protein TcmP [Chloroflexota bacterium]|jgi:three-Cys-motif partner protein